MIGAVNEPETLAKQAFYRYIAKGFNSLLVLNKKFY
jgi:hypothetical protein